LLLQQLAIILIYLFRLGSLLQQEAARETGVKMGARPRLLARWSCDDFEEPVVANNEGQVLVVLRMMVADCL
jgi:hypothetical protein